MERLCDQTGSGKNFIALPNSRHGIYRNFNGYAYVFEFIIPLELIEILCDQTGSGKFKMVATQLQIHVPRPLPDILLRTIPLR